MRLVRPAVVVPFLSAAWLWLAAVPAAGAAETENWPRWRGPRDNGTSGPGAYPVTWSDASNLLWTVALPGKGSSTPIVWEHRIYLTAPVDGNDAVLAFDWDGKPLWQTVFSAERAGKHKAGSGSNPSVATDGKGLFAYFKSGTLAALELGGKVRWKTNLQELYGPDNMIWDVGASPVLAEKDVVATMMRSGDSYLAAFDKVTGKLHWKVARNYETAFEADQGYTTPLVIDFQGREALLAWGAEHLTVHDAADGKVLWSCGDFNPEKKSNWPPVATPVIENGIVVVPYGRGMRCHGIRLDGTGDVTASNRLWVRDDTGSYTPTPTVYRGIACIVTEKGRMDGLDPATGKTVWSVEFPKGAGRYFSSPTLAGGHIYVVRDDGRVFVVEMGDPPALVADIPLGENVCASPVPVEGRLLFRGDKSLFCVGVR